MKLTDAEKALLDGSQGLGRQKAMELLVKYGEALGAERLVDTNNVCVSVTAGAYSTARPALTESDIDAALFLASELSAWITGQTLFVSGGLPLLPPGPPMGK